MVYSRVVAEEENQSDARPLEREEAAILIEREEVAKLIEDLEDLEDKVMEIILSK